MDETTTGTLRPGGGLRVVLAWVAIAGLLVLVVWLASERNARNWYLVPEDGRLVVMRGVLLPVGRRTFESSDPALSQAYAPLAPPAGKALPAERAFEERSLLDQAMYDVLAAWARDEIASGDPARLERGLGYLTRAERLPGLSPSQRDDLAALRAESGYHEALRLLSRAGDDLRDVADKLRVAASSRSAHASDAEALLGEVEPALQATLGAVRAGKASRQAPPAEKPGTSQGTPAGDSGR